MHGNLPRQALRGRFLSYAKREKCSFYNANVTLVNLKPNRRRFAMPCMDCIQYLKIFTGQVQACTKTGAHRHENVEVIPNARRTSVASK